MSIVNVEVSLPGEAFALGQILHDHGNLRIDLAQFVPIEDAFVPYVWVETGDQSVFEEAVEHDERVASLSALDSTGDRTLYKLEWAMGCRDDDFLAAVTAHDLVIEDATGTEERWRFRLRGPNHENLADVQQELLEEDIPVYIHRVWQPEASSENSYGLTDIQRETLERAYREGYFSVPRNASLEDLGRLLGVSH